MGIRKTSPPRPSPSPSDRVNRRDVHVPLLSERSASVAGGRTHRSSPSSTVIPRPILEDPIRPVSPIPPTSRGLNVPVLSTTRLLAQELSPRMCLAPAIPSSSGHEGFNTTPHSHFYRYIGLVIASVGFLVSIYAFVQIEVFSGQLVYHFLWWSVTAPQGRSGTATWPFSGCVISGSLSYGIPGQRCLFPNYDETVMLFALVMGAGLVLRYYHDQDVVERRRIDRLKWAFARATNRMGVYTTSVFAWCVVLFGALPTWDQSVIWAESVTSSYPAPTWDPITNTCLVGFPGRTGSWPSCTFPNFFECLAVSLMLVILTYTLMLRYSGREAVELA